MLRHNTITFLFVIALAGFILSGLSWWLCVLLLLIYLSVTAYGCFSIQSNYFLKSISSLRGNNNTIYLTFDDGPAPETLEVLKILAQWNAKATFFCIGKEVENHTEVLLKIHKEGHLIGSHTYSHIKTFPVFNQMKMNNDIAKAQIAIQKQINLKPLLFRPPFGVTNPRIAASVKVLGLNSIGWNKRSLDTVSKSRSYILDRVCKNLKAGDIILFHDNIIGTGEMLQEFFLRIKDKGFNYDRIDQNQDIQAYEKLT